MTAANNFILHFFKQLANVLIFLKTSPGVNIQTSTSLWFEPSEFVDDLYV
jgi:hypothetical protein